MTHTVVGLFRDSVEADVAVRDLVDAGFAHADISLVAPEHSPTEPESTEDSSGTAKGAAIGGLAGALLGVAGIAIPGIGPLLAAGPIAAVLAGAGVGAAAGGMLAALHDLGIPEQEALHWQEGLKRGGTLVAVHAGEEALGRAQRILDQHGAIDIEGASEHRSRLYKRR
jgi:hypothetical protein